MFNTLFEEIYLIEFVLISIVRTAHTGRYRRLAVAVDRKTIPDIALMALAGVGMLAPLVYLLSSLLDFADYTLPGWIGWPGAILFAVAIGLLWRSHSELGRNWTPTLGFRDNHRLVTSGVFRYIRHPMYAAHILWGIATALMIGNWIAGYALLVATVAHYLSRVGAEEVMMLERFGGEYETYMRWTGRIIPRIRTESERS